MKGEFCSEKSKEIEICKEKELKKHLSISNKRCITGDTGKLCVTQ
jgi:hypothetical protein